MKHTLLAAAVYAGLFAALFPPIAGCAEAQADQGSVGLTQIHSTPNTSDELAQLLMRIDALPSLQAARSRVTAASLALSAADKPVYNPELGLGYQAADTDSYSLSISQTVDWGDKRAAAAAEALLLLRRAEAELAMEQSRLIAEALGAMVAQDQARAVLAVQTEERRLAENQLKYARERKALGLISGGELSMLELELAGLDAGVAMAEQALIDTQTLLLGLFGTLELPTISLAALMQASQSQPAMALSQTPALQLAYQDVQLGRIAVQKAKADTSADPTFSLDAEKEGEDNKLGLNVSIPLKVRNQYGDVIAAAAESAVVAQQQYLASERALTQAKRQFDYAQPKLRASWQSWQQRVQGSGAALGASFTSQWRAGDISTSDFLQGKRQLTQSQIVGVELEARLYQHWLDWMGQSGQLSSLMSSAKTQGAKP